MFLSKHLRGAVSTEHDAKVLADSGGTREQLTGVVDKHHGGVDEGSSNDREDHVSYEFHPANVVIGKGDNKDVLWVTSQGQRGTNVGSGSKGEEVWKGVGDLVSDAKIDDDAGEDEDDRVVHDSGGTNGRHGHDLGRSLPVHRVVKGVTKLVEETSTLHLFKIDGGKHETEKQEKRFHNDNSFSVETRSLSGDDKNVTEDNHGKSTSKSDTRTADRKEPVRKHEENPEGEVDDRDEDLSEDGELS